MSKTLQFTSDDLEFALEQAAEFLDMEEWPGDNPEAQHAANQEAARRIRAMVKRLVTRRMKHTATRRQERTGMNIQGKNVELERDLCSYLSDQVIPKGTPGLVKWDEGGDEVIVEFNFDVPQSSNMDNSRQAWVSRNMLNVTLEINEKGNKNV